MRKKILIALVACIALAATVHAGTQVTVVNDGAPQHGEVDFSAADSADINSRVAYPSVPVTLNGHKTIFVAPTASVASATMKIGIAVGIYDANSDKWTAGPYWVQTGTLTADGTIKSNGNYVVPGVELPAGGWTHFQVHVDAISSGNAFVFWSAY